MFASVSLSTYALLVASSLYVGLELSPRIVVVELDDPILIILVPDVAKLNAPALVPLLPRVISPVEKSPVIKFRSVIDVKLSLPSIVYELLEMYNLSDLLITLSWVGSLAPASTPINTLPSPLTVSPAAKPKTVLLLPVVAYPNAETPTTVLYLPVVFSFKEAIPTAVFSEPVVLFFKEA